jgi:hypothetical protein
MSGIGQEFMAPILQDQTYRQNERTLPVELAQKAANTRYTTALADRVESETAAEKKVAAMMAQQAGMPPGAGGAGSISDLLLGQSDMWAKAGSPVKAAALAQQAAQARAHEATARAAQVREAAAKVKMQGDQFKRATELLSGVKDQESWQNANTLFEKETGQESPFKSIPYDPDTVKALQGAAMTAYQKAQVELRGKAVQATITNVASEIKSRAVRDGVALERLRVSQQREQRLSKAGGKDIGAPGKAEVSAADKLIGDTGLEGDERDAAAFSIASEAKMLRRKNSALSADEALRQAALTAKMNGSITPGQHNYLSPNVPAKFNAPVSLPTSGKKSDLVPGQLYKQGDKTARWTKDGWQLVGKSAPKAEAPSGGGGSSDGEDPEGDDNE